jgi:ABC-2 type transport system ATP-binding protein
MVEARGLWKRFGRTEALRGVDLSVRQGVIFALVGPDGAGKTTLLRILAGIMTPDEGSLDIIGCDAVKDPESIKDKTGYLSQRFSLNPVLTVEENIHFFGALYKVPAAARATRIKRLLEFSRLGPFKKRQAARLSGGMKQKLSLCCSLIHTPKLLLLDEPTTGVDPISRRELWEILYDLLGEGVTVIVSTPYMDEAERAGEIMLLHEGRRLITGDMPELRSRFGFALFEMITDNNRSAYELLSRKLGHRRTVFFGEKLHLALDSRDDAADMKSLIEDSGTEVKVMEQIEPGLEDAFIQEIVGG